MRGGDLRGDRRALYQDLKRKDKEDRQGTTGGPRGWPDRDEAAGLDRVWLQQTGKDLGYPESNKFK